MRPATIKRFGSRNQSTIIVSNQNIYYILIRFNCDWYTRSLGRESKQLHFILVVGIKSMCGKLWGVSLSMIHSEWVCDAEWMKYIDTMCTENPSVKKFFLLTLLSLFFPQYDFHKHMLPLLSISPARCCFAAADMYCNERKKNTWFHSSMLCAVVFVVCWVAW